MALHMSKKGLTSYIAFISFVIMAVTGIVLFFEPQGRVAYWTHWGFLGLSKAAWDELHLTSSVLFTCAAIYHLVLNWRVFVSYLREKAGEVLRPRPELWISLAVGLVLIAGTLYRVPPFSSVVHLGVHLKDSWVSSPEEEPPYGHAELSRLRVLAKRMDIEPRAALIAMQERGVSVKSVEQVFDDIARDNDMSPMELFGVISYLIPREEVPRKWTPAMVEERYEGTGVGHKQLRWIMRDAEVDEARWLARLAEAGINAISDETIKETADRNNTAPMEVLKAALIDGYTPERE